jgi:hypothetical protein
MSLKTNAKEPFESNPFEFGVDGSDVGLDALGASSLDKYKCFFRDRGSWRCVIYIHDPRFISNLHQNVKKLVASDAHLFSVGTGKGYSFITSEPLGVKFAEIFGADFDDFRREYPMHRFSSYFEAIEKTRFKFTPDMLEGRYTRFVAERVVKSLNKRVTALRRRLRCFEVVQAYSNFRRSPVENFNGLMGSMQRAVDLNPNQLVVRFDLHYRVSGRDPSAEDIEADIDELAKVQKCRERFHRSIDRKLGPALRGFAFCLEYGQHRRWHYHYLLFVDPSYTDDDVAFVETFQATWRDVTDGQGELYNGNAHKSRHRYQAVGFMDANDENVLVGLRAIASYFTLAGLYVQLKLPKRVKTFGKGRFPAPQAKPGRPLKRTSPRLRISLAEARDQIRFI